MIPERHEAADHEGTFCVLFTTTDYSNPSIVSHYWPTVLKTRDVLLFFFDDASATDKIALLQVKKTIPGEYFVGIKDEHFGATWKQGQHVRLLHGGATQPVHTVVRDAPVPKVRKGTQCYWSSGQWVKRTKTGKPESIDPLGVQS